MTRQIDPRTGIRNAHGQSSRRRRPLWWILAAVVALVILVVVAVAVFIKQPAPPPLSLPPGAAAAPVGPASGTWQVAAGSVAGFRIPDTALGLSNEVVGRTNSVTGAIVIVGDQVTRATLRIGLASIKVSGKTQPQLARSLGTRQFPAATFTLTRPVLLGHAFASGATIKVTATGELTMHGASHLVTVRISGRRDGRVLQAAGSIPVPFAEWGIRGPAGSGFLGSLASHGVAEFLLTLHRH
jgi:polyisoprenoid-binding protein YceI